MASTQTRIRTLLDELNHELFEKEQVVGLSLLSAIAGESIFLLGPPGVAKSLVARRLKYAFQHARSFEYLMGKFSTPDEVFGPVSISKLKEEDKYERLVDHYLPGAQIVFLDEIWKASPPIQNSLLTVLNEKLYRNGENEIRVDIRGLIAASNELPLRGEGLEALWDRFLIRMVTTGIRDTGRFNAMLTLNGGSEQKDMVSPEIKISDEEYVAWSEAINHIQVPLHVLGVINYLRLKIEERNEDAGEENTLYVSDRRWRKIVRLMRASAFLNDRKEVDLMDCFLIPHCIWDHPSQTEETEALVKKAIVSHGFRSLINLEPIQKELQLLQKEIQGATREMLKEPIHEKVLYQDKGNRYYKLPNFWRADPVFIRTEDFEKLKKDKEVFIPVYEQSYQTFQPFQTYGFRVKSAKILITKDKEVPLETREVLQEQVLTRPPSAEEVAIWGGVVAQLLQRSEQALQRIEERKHQEKKNLSRHLFVSPQHAEFILESLKKATDEILRVRLETEKIKHSYESVRADR